MKKIFILGSFVYDLVTSMDRFPEAKESVVGNKFETFPGGKGANQCIAISRLGGDLVINGKVGKDNFGDNFIEILKKENISTDFIKRSEESTGIGCVQLDGNGQNRICIVLGANHDFQKEDLAIDELKKCDIFLTQFEMRREITEYGIKVAKENNLITIVNPAPAREISKDIYPLIDYLTPNEKELGFLVNKEVLTIEDAHIAAEELLTRGVKNVICTLGEKGSLLVNKDLVIYQTAFKIKPVDTVAAGDSFNGAFAYCLANDFDLDYSLKFANAMGALTTLTKGAIPSIKRYDDVMEFLKNNGD